MNKKRIAALVAASTMLLSSVAANASTLNTVTKGGVDVTTGSSGTVTSSGTVNAWDDTPIYEVTLPTTNALEFLVDPYNLINNPDVASGGALVDDLIANATGTIAPTASSGALIQNDSSKPVVVTAKFWVTDSADEIEFQATQADAQVPTTDSSTKMFLAIVPSSTKALTTASYSAAKNAIAVTATGNSTDIPSDTSASFLLDKADYMIIEAEESGVKGYKMVKADNGSSDGTILMVGGYANPYASWKSYASLASGGAATLALNAVFEYREPVENSDVLASGSGVYALVSGSAVTPYATVKDLGLIQDQIGVNQSNYLMYWDMSEQGFPTESVTKFKVSVDGTTYSEINDYIEDGTYVGFFNTNWENQYVEITIGTTTYTAKLYE